MTLPRVFPRQKQIIKRIAQTVQGKPTETYTVNRNPRNLEFLRIAYKNRGYDLDAKFSKDAHFWHKLVITPSGKFVTAQVVHVENGPVVEASTKEWCIKKNLFKTSDTAAYMNLARVFADRCLQSGILEMAVQPGSGGKFEKFIEIVKENGVVLEESPDIYCHIARDVNRFKGKRMEPTDWKEIVQSH